MSISLSVVPACPSKDEKTLKFNHWASGALLARSGTHALKISCKETKKGEQID